VAGVNDSAELQARTVAEGHNLFSPNAALPTTDWPATEALHTSGVAERIQRPGGGVPLDPSVEFAMGEQMGHDFGRVRIHADAEAGTMAQQLGANAFTYRNDIYFGAGRFAPDVDRGRSLLAHELTHVAQGGDVVRRDPSGSLPNPSYVAGTAPATLTGGGTASAGDGKFVAGPGAPPSLEKFTAFVQKSLDAAQRLEETEDESNKKKAFWESNDNGFHQAAGVLRSLAGQMSGIIDKLKTGSVMTSKLGGPTADTEKLSKATGYINDAALVLEGAAIIDANTKAIERFNKTPNLETATEWANSVTMAFDQLGSTLERVLPDEAPFGTIKAYYVGLMRAPKVYVGTFLRLMGDRYREIDKILGSDTAPTGDEWQNQRAVEPGGGLIGDKVRWKGVLSGLYVNSHFCQKRSSEGRTLEQFLNDIGDREGAALFKLSEAAGKQRILELILTEAPADVRDHWANWIINGKALE
jgi:hypothetical protein